MNITIGDKYILNENEYEVCGTNTQMYLRKYDSKSKMYIRVNFNNTSNNFKESVFELI